MSVLKYPLATEKSIRQMESENKIIFVVDNKATKKDIRKDVEEMFEAKIESVHTLTDRNGNKRAYVKFNIETPALDIATKLGMM